MKTASKTICALLFNMLMGAIIATLLGAPPLVGMLFTVAIRHHHELRAGFQRRTPRRSLYRGMDTGELVEGTPRVSSQAHGSTAFLTNRLSSTTMSSTL